MKTETPFTVSTFDSAQDAEADDLRYWLSLSPEERLDAVGECVQQYLELTNEPEQRFQRVYKVLELRKG
ncbi:MAG: hypothetical protein JXR45_20195 [Deltaproteobacteria bacterium]|nr:hypothetical protein [Deltaproteobacteria bacterium]